MVAMYTIAGRQVGSHVLAMATLGTTFVGSWLAMSGGSKPEQQSGPAINAKTKEEESFIKNFVKKAEDDKSKH